MEDAHIAEPNLQEGVSLFAVFDGHGGPEVAKFCSKYFPIYLKQNKNFIIGEFKTALEETFLTMDELLMSDEGSEMLKEFRGEQNISNSFAGCTANVVLIVGNMAYVANAGDSRAIIYTTSNEVIPLSFDHKPDVETEKKRINNAGGYVKTVS